MGEGWLLFLIIDIPVLWGFLTAISMRSRQRDYALEHDGAFYMFAVTQVVAVVVMIVGPSDLRFRLLVYSLVAEAWWLLR